MQRFAASPSVEAPRPRRGQVAHHLPMLAILTVLLPLAALLLIRLALGAFEIFVRDADKTTDPTPVTVTIGGTALSIPANMIRFSVERGGPQSKADLHVHWPSLEGFTAERGGLFQGSAVDSPIVYMTIRSSHGAMAPEERFRTVYPRVLADGMREEPDGMVVRSFREGFGYDGEELYIARDPEQPLVARCLPEGSGGVVICMSEFRTDQGVDVGYRFQKHMMDEWRTLDLGVRGLVADFLAEARD